MAWVPWYGRFITTRSFKVTPIKRNIPHTFAGAKPQLQGDKQGLDFTPQQQPDTAWEQVRGRPGSSKCSSLPQIICSYSKTPLLGFAPDTDKQFLSCGLRQDVYALVAAGIGARLQQSQKHAQEG